MIELRPYQQECFNAVIGAAQAGQTRQLVVMPTGTGKTIVFVQLAKIATGRTLFLAHRDELIRQAADKLVAAGADPAEVGICKAARDELGRRYVVASVQTISRSDRLERVEPGTFSLLIVDEAHHAAAESYRRVIDHIGARLTLGWTATPDRLDGEGLADLFGPEPVFSYGIREAIADGWLCGIRQYAISTDVDLEGVHTRGGDFVDGELSRAVNDPTRNKLVVEAWETRGGLGRPTVVFGVTVDHVRALSEAFTDRGHRAAVVHAGTPADERAAVLSLLAGDDLDAVCNVGILTEGWNCPPVSCVCMARPTKSRSLYQQCIGRTLRPSDGKPDALILDFTDNAHRHKLITVGSLFGTEAEDFGGRTLDEVEQHERDACSSRVGTTGRSPAYNAIFADEVDPLAAPCLDGYAPLYDWQFEPATEKQVRTLGRFGIDLGRPPTKGEASYLLKPAFDRRAASPATGKQRWFLRCRGINPSGMTFAKARRLIGELKGLAVA